MTKEARLKMMTERFNAHREAEISKLMDEPPYPDSLGVANPTAGEITEEVKSLPSFEEHSICAKETLTSDE